MLAPFPSSLVSFLQPLKLPFLKWSFATASLFYSHHSSVGLVPLYLFTQLLLYSNCLMLFLPLISMPLNSLHCCQSTNLAVSCPCLKTLIVTYYLQKNIYSPQYGLQSLPVSIANARISGKLSTRNTSRFVSHVLYFHYFVGTFPRV